MTPALLAGLIMLAIAVIVVVASAVGPVVRMLHVRAAVTRLESHPVTSLAPRAQRLVEQTADWGERIAAIQPRVLTIVRNATLLLATSAALRLDVRRIGSATEGLLEAFVPRLRGGL